jgi:Zn-dependent membrane protease YugP
MYDQPLFFFDVMAVTMMLVLAYLSKRVGEARYAGQDKPYYVILFLTAGAVVAASGLETIPRSLSFGFITTVTGAIRFGASVIAFAVTFRYWSWLFAEFSKK